MFYHPIHQEIIILLSLSLVWECGLGTICQGCFMSLSTGYT